MSGMELHFVVVSSRKEQKAALKAERLRREAEQDRAAQRKRLVAIVAGGIVVLAASAAVAAAVLSGGGDDGGGSGGSGESASVSYPDGGSLPELREVALDEAAEAAGCTVRSYEEEGSGHVETPVAYESNPPHSGEHHPVPAEDDLYEDEQPREPFVHSLEHGRIVIWVRPDADEQFLGKLKALYEQDPYHVILTPDSKLDAPVAASAWRRTLVCDETSDQVFDALRAFQLKWRDKGPEFVP